MKIVHVPFGFYPDASGGTEVYVAGLAAEQQRRGNDALVVAPGSRDAHYEHNGVPVRRFAISPRLSLHDLYVAGDAVAAGGFARILDEERPDLVHLHALTSAVSLRLLLEAKRRGLPVVFSYHTPTISCQRGTLLHWGSELCDGRLDARRCGACTLHGKGASKLASHGIAAMPRLVGQTLGALRLEGGPWTALRTPALVNGRHTTLRAFVAVVDRVVALCGWTRDLLARIGVPIEKIALSRHGLSPRSTEAFCVFASDPHTRALRVAYIGRLDPTKGVELLIAALDRLRGVSIQLDIYGIAQPGNEPYVQELYRSAARDTRIAFKPPVPNEHIPSVLSGYDILAVPSQWLETGPLVVLEAFAAGVPVVGSDLGGIAELVRHECDGLLVNSTDIDAWAEALRRLSDDAQLRKQLRAGVRPPRTAEDVADDMDTVYAPLVYAQTLR